MAERLCFPENDPVTGPPVVNGHTGEDVHDGILTTEFETGYSGTRLTYSNGSLLPRVVFQGVKRAGEDFLHFSFFARFDPTFDAEDVVVLALRPSHAASSHGPDTRRFDIYPVLAGVGARPPGPDNPPPQPSELPDPTSWHIRTDRVANVEAYKGISSPPAGEPLWTSVAPPPGFEVKVRSFTPPYPSPQHPNSDVVWSVEVKLPIGLRDELADWIQLQETFGLYFNVIRCWNVPSPSCTQDTWPRNRALTGPLALGEFTEIATDNFGPADIPALMSPYPGPNNCLGVKFVKGELSIGVLRSGVLSHEIDLSPGSINRLMAEVHNTDPVNPAQGVTAEFRLANWGLGAGEPSAWTRIEGDTIPPTPGNTNPTQPTTIAAGGATHNLSFDWELTADDIVTYKDHPHQCMWVLLDSAQAVNFVEAAERRNMDFVDLSELDRPAEISGMGYPAPPGGGANHKFVLLTAARRTLIDDPKPPDIGITTHVPARRKVPVWVWILQGYRETGDSIRIGNTRFKVMDPSPGAFGYVINHEEWEADELRIELRAPGLRRENDDIYTLPVPHEGKVTLQTHVEAGPPRPSGPDVKGCWVKLLELLRRLFRR